MALASAIRRASSPVFPLAIHAIGGQTSASFNSALNFHECPMRPLRSQPYSSAVTSEVAKKNVDEKLVRIIKSQIKSLKPVPDMPKRFPFSIQYTSSDGILELRKEDQDESIAVELEMSALQSEVYGSSCDTSTDDDSDNYDDDEDDPDNTTDDESEDSDADVITDEYSQGGDSDGDGDGDSSSYEEEDKDGFPMIVRVSKRDGFCLQFHVNASPGNVSIQNMFMKDLNHHEYDVPDFSFSDLDLRLKQGFNKYLEVRGIKPSLVQFLYNYTINQNRELELAWLRKLKKFIKK